MPIYAHPEHCARRETQLREETLVRDLLHLSMGNPRTYQQVLLLIDQQVRKHLPAPTRDGSATFSLDDVTNDAIAAIHRAGGSVEYIEDASTYHWFISLPKRAILCTMALDNGCMAYCINNGKDHLVIGQMERDTEYAYEGCDVIH